jgi:hypothetical protein
LSHHLLSKNQSPLAQKEYEKWDDQLQKGLSGMINEESSKDQEE